MRGKMPQSAREGSVTPPPFIRGWVPPPGSGRAPRAAPASAAGAVAPCPGRAVGAGRCCRCPTGRRAAGAGPCVGRRAAGGGVPFRFRLGDSPRGSVAQVRGP